MTDGIPKKRRSIFDVWKASKSLDEGKLNNELPTKGKEENENEMRALSIGNSEARSQNASSPIKLTLKINGNNDQELESNIGEPLKTTKRRSWIFGREKETGTENSIHHVSESERKGCEKKGCDAKGDISFHPVLKEKESLSTRTHSTYKSMSEKEEDICDSVKMRKRRSWIFGHEKETGTEESIHQTSEREKKGWEEGKECMQKGQNPFNPVPSEREATGTRNHCKNMEKYEGDIGDSVKMIKRRSWIFGGEKETGTEISVHQTSESERKACDRKGWEGKRCNRKGEISARPVPKENEGLMDMTDSVKTAKRKSWIFGSEKETKMENSIHQASEKERKGCERKGCEIIECDGKVCEKKVCMTKTDERKDCNDKGYKGGEIPFQPETRKKEVLGKRSSSLLSGIKGQGNEKQRCSFMQRSIMKRTTKDPPLVNQSRFIWDPRVYMKRALAFVGFLLRLASLSIVCCWDRINRGLEAIGQIAKASFTSAAVALVNYTPRKIIKRFMVNSCRVMPYLRHRSFTIYLFNTLPSHVTKRILSTYIKNVPHRVMRLHVMAALRDGPAKKVVEGVVRILKLPRTVLETLFMSVASAIEAVSRALTRYKTQPPKFDRSSSFSISLGFKRQSSLPSELEKKL